VAAIRTIRDQPTVISIHQWSTHSNLSAPAVRVTTWLFDPWLPEVEKHSPHREDKCLKCSLVQIYLNLVYLLQGCGSGSGLDPDPDWIRIRIGSGFSDLVDPDPYWESGSRGKKMKKFHWKSALFSYLKKNLPPKRYRYKIALTTFWKKNFDEYAVPPAFFIWFDSNLRRKLSSKVLF
jgi:hypothetical protein